MAVGRSSEGNEDGGAACSSNFRGGDGPRAADDNVGPAKTLGHVGKERNDLGKDFAPRIGGPDSVIVAFASLMDDAEFFFSRSEAVHGIHKCAIDGQRTLTPSGDEQAQRISRLTRGNGKEFGTYGAAGNDGFFSPSLRRNFIASGNAVRKARQDFVGAASLGI